MSIHSKNKGKAGELEVAALLKEFGFEARRGQQFAGGGDSPDVVHNIPKIHIEVKRVEQFAMWDALAQATRDAADGRMPTVWHRKNKKDWVVVVDAREFLDLMKHVTFGGETAQ